ncbi:5-(carboxyamino)imidazole ribonucleotide synthase [Cerasicoccus arenae]|uniref:N5-carboxyaminoimidazole ribonucleotide synthase n=1 Tax=Cerasicoccus arenae TaxID=424488 RepID=A0A8J3GDS7_9BACT|nr:5-(carboxyamino)imidazole ribonucleotide synthase [Cerasicoccus arenae]MBK1859329.1 5-(carboxyamino)imidazole ribonucleotide synthase [Cerasicoccus arenae]GHB93907.1 N5-carboxyaminoimidazole ribonucleotide synthase [Cerasicoccus arenae]
MTKPFQPGATIGMLGGGQLGRMSILAGRAMGYRFRVFEPSAGGAAAMVADTEVNADYDDAQALADFARSCDVVTLEFENVAHEAVDVITGENVPVRPSGDVLHICQNRRREKEFLRANDIPCANFRVVANANELAQATQELGVPCVLKTAAFGYDGKGQVKIEDLAADFDAIWAGLGCPLGVVEAWVPFSAECSVIVARGPDGAMTTFPVAENIHRHHILHQSIVPARLPAETLAEAANLARGVAEAIGVIGLLAVELFVKPDGSVLVNELAPRPHNSGHYSMDACQTSQFEQHIRAVCGLPLGDTRLLRPAVMVNLLGDVWQGGEAPDWAILLADPDVKLHLYDKGAPRPGRKMGHFTVLKNTVEEALATAESLFSALK